ncbi:hypothetical protein [Streptomyces eurythermus]
MAMRGTPARRYVGSPLVGVLRSLDQRARIAGRARTGASFEQNPTPPEVTRPAPVAAPGGPAAAVLVTREDGRVEWRLPSPYGAPPAVAATAVDPELGTDERTVWAALEEVTAWCVVARVWCSRGRGGAGAAEPAGPGLTVHLMAFPLTRT